MKQLPVNNKYAALIIGIGSLLEQGRRQAYHAVNAILVKTYWQVGQRIVEYEQKGKEKAEYGSALLKRLSTDLNKLYKKGFSVDNLENMRGFYLAFPNSETLSR